jgi:S-formylglutathione hydrolase
MLKHINTSIIRRITFIAAVIALSVTAIYAGQTAEGRLIREVIRAKTIENRPAGEPAERNVSIYLPPGYDANTSKRYPVVYLLHGITDSDTTWTKPWSKETDGYSTIPDIMNKGIAESRFGEMIVVMPDQNTKAFGSFYVNSSATGDWADLTAKELVSYIDGKYRTISSRNSRGIVGHSMGGYGALTLGMKHPDVYSVVYGLNPAIMGWAADFTPETPAFQRILLIKSFDELMKSRDLYTMATVTLAQAFSPNPTKPPFFADFPFEMVDGKMQPTAAYAKWESHFPIKMVPRYADNLKKLRGLRFD